MLNRDKNPKESSVLDGFQTKSMKTAHSFKNCKTKSSGVLSTKTRYSINQKIETFDISL